MIGASEVYCFVFLAGGGGLQTKWECVAQYLVLLLIGGSLYTTRELRVTWPSWCNGQATSWQMESSITPMGSKRTTSYNKLSFFIGSHLECIDCSSLCALLFFPLPLLWISYCGFAAIHFLATPLSPYQLRITTDKYVRHLQRHLFQRETEDTPTIASAHMHQAQKLE